MNRLMRILKKTVKGLVNAILFPITTLMLIPKVRRINNDGRLSIIDHRGGFCGSQQPVCGNKIMKPEDDNHPEHLRISLYYGMSAKYLRKQFDAWRFVKLFYPTFICVDTLFPLYYPYGLYFFKGGTILSISACLFLPIVHRLAICGFFYGADDDDALQETWDHFSYTLKSIFIKNPRTRLDKLVGYAANTLRDYSTLTPHQLAQWGPLKKVHAQMKSKILPMEAHDKLISNCCFPSVASQDINNIILAYTFSPALVVSFNNFKETGKKLNMSISDRIASDDDEDIAQSYDTFATDDVILDVSENSENYAEDHRTVLIQEYREGKYQMDNVYY